MWSISCARGRALIAAAVVAGTAFAAAAEGWFELPLAGGTRTLAHLGIEPRDRAHTIPLVARVLYGNETRGVTTLPRLTAFLRTASTSPGDADGGEAVSIPVPLTREAWQSLLGTKSDSDLAARLLTDRAATLVASGLAATDASVRELATRKPDFLRRLYAETPGAFTVAARSLRIQGGALAVPGGDAARAAWETLAGASAAQPDAFIHALLSRDDGRLAWFFDTMAAAPAPLPVDSLPALYESFRRVDQRWRLEDHPFRRTAGDPASLLALVALADDATVVGPPWHWFWDAVFERRAIDREAAARLNPGPDLPVSVSWMAAEIAASSSVERRDRFEMLRLAQRVFPAPRVHEANDLAVAFSAYRTHRALLLTLERLRITTPSTWAAVTEAARHVDRAGGNRREALITFQAAVALIARAYQMDGLDSAGAEQRLLALGASVLAAERVPTAVRAWLTKTWPSDRSLIDTLAGPPPRDQRLVKWEGLEYLLDFSAAERERLTSMLRVLGAPSVEAALKTEDDAALAAALLAWSYATALGDPAGAIALAPDLPRRHDFGLHGTALLQETLPWALADEQQGTGRTWHVRGSLIGLDLALARLSLRHIGDEMMPSQPMLSLNDFATFARTRVAMQPRRLRDDDRDEIVAAIARGRARVPGDTFVPLRELLWLGQPKVPQDRLDDWGMFAQPLDGRLLLAMPRPRAWEDFAGRSDSGQLSTQVPDLTLRLAEETARLQLPAALVPGMLAGAVQDYWYGANVRFNDDYPTMARTAARLRPERAEDYVAALAGGGPLRLRERK